MRAAPALLLLLAFPAAAQVPVDAGEEPASDARVAAAAAEDERPRTPALALLLGVVAAAALSLFPRRG